MKRILVTIAALLLLLTLIPVSALALQLVPGRELRWSGPEDCRKLLEAPETLYGFVEAAETPETDETGWSDAMTEVADTGIELDLEGLEFHDELPDDLNELQGFITE